MSNTKTEIIKKVWKENLDDDFPEFGTYTITEWQLIENGKVIETAENKSQLIEKIKNK